MSQTKKFLSVIRADKKLLGMFSGIVFNFSVIIAMIIWAFM